MDERWLIPKKWNPEEMRSGALCLEILTTVEPEENYRRASVISRAPETINQPSFCPPVIFSMEAPNSDFQRLAFSFMAAIDKAVVFISDLVP